MVLLLRDTSTSPIPSLAETRYRSQLESQAGSNGMELNGSPFAIRILTSIRSSSRIAAEHTAYSGSDVQQCPGGKKGRARDVSLGGLQSRNTTREMPAIFTRLSGALSTSWKSGMVDEKKASTTYRKAALAKSP